MIDLDPDTGIRRTDATKALADYRRRHNEVLFGVDAVVTKPGRVTSVMPRSSRPAQERDPQDCFRGHLADLDPSPQWATVRATRSGYRPRRRAHRPAPLARPGAARRAPCAGREQALAGRVQILNVGEGHRTPAIAPGFERPRSH